MGLGPSDWEKGVLAAAAWMRDRTGDSEQWRIDLMLRDLTPDTEGTETRVVKEIATWLRERAERAEILTDEPLASAIAFKAVQLTLTRTAESIERFEWRQS